MRIVNNYISDSCGAYIDNHIEEIIYNDNLKHNTEIKRNLDNAIWANIYREIEDNAFNIMKSIL